MRKTDTSRLSVDGLRPGTAIFDLDKCVEIKRWAVKFCDFTVIRDGHPLLLAVFEFKKGWCDASDIIKQLSGGVRWLDAHVSDQPIRSLIPVLVFSKGISPNELRELKKQKIEYRGIRYPISIYKSGGRLEDVLS